MQIIPGSEPTHGAGGIWTEANSDQLLRPTLVVRRPASAEELGQQLLAGSLPRHSREDAAKLLRADPADLDAVGEFARSHNLQITTENAAARTIQLQGSIVDLSKAFGVDIKQYTDEQGHSYLSYQGPLTLPASLANIVEAVLGLDQRPLAERKASQ